MTNFRILTVLLLAVFPLIMWAEDEPPTSQDTYEISAWGWLTYGRVQKSYWDEDRHGYYDYEREWLNNIEIGFFLKRNFTERSWGKLHVNHPLFWPVKDKRDRDFKSLNKTVRTRVLEASIYLDYFQSENVSADVRIGYFSYKYNPQAMNLGEYMFRSTPYPQYLMSGFEIADKVKIPGVKFGLTFFESLRHEFFIRSETEVPPLYDFSFAYLLQYNPHPSLDVGAGFDLYRLISAKPEITTPSKDTIAFSSNLGDKFFTHYMDENDSVKASFAGTKAVARITLDPKPFFSSRHFGAEDFKLYAEAIVLGLRDYPAWHEDILHRIPVMVGFNIPTFKILDVLALEVEYFASPYANSPYNIWDKRTPLPYIGASVPISPENDTYKNSRRDNWKWSLYGSRRVGKYLRFSGQLANDHSPRYQVGGLPNEDITQTPKDWYWMFRIMYYI